MFGIDGIEFLIILIVIVVVVGPKDLPKMMRAFGQAMARMRHTEGEIRGHFDEGIREAELGDVADTLRQTRNLDPRKKLTEIFDPLREVTHDIQSSLREQGGGDKPDEKGADEKGESVAHENTSVEKVAIGSRKATLGKRKTPGPASKTIKAAKATKSAKAVKSPKTVQTSGDSSN